METEQNRILELQNILLKDKSMYKLVEMLDVSVNLYGLRISDVKHIFLRLARQEGSLVIWAREEYIPQQDSLGNWIEQPNDLEQKFKVITPSLDYIPNDLSADTLINRMEVFLNEMIAYRISSNQLKQDSDVKELLRGAMKAIRA